MQEYTLKDLKDAVKQAVANDKAPGSNRVAAALIAELHELVHGVLVHAYSTNIYSHSHSHNHLSCRLLVLPGISHRQVVPALLDPVGPRAA